MGHVPTAEKVTNDSGDSAHVMERRAEVRDTLCPHGLHHNGYYCEDCNG